MQEQASFNFQSILNNLKTLEEANYLLSALETLLSNQFKTKEGEPTEGFKKHITFPAFEILAKSLAENKVSLNQRSMAADFLQRLRETIETLPVLSLTLAFVPSDLFIIKISQWIKTATNKTVLLSIAQKENLLGGVILVYNGHYRDHSLVKKIDAVFKEKGEEILKISYDSI